MHVGGVCQDFLFHGFNKLWFVGLFEGLSIRHGVLVGLGGS
jgi:hypothetical protein